LERSKGAGAEGGPPHSTQPTLIAMESSSEFEKSKNASSKMLRAAARGDISTLQDETSVEYHVDAVGAGGEGFACVHAASEAGKQQCVQWLVDQGCDVNIRSRKQQQTALHLAGSAAVARTLLNAGASPTLKDKLQQTPLQRFKSIKLSGDAAASKLAGQIVNVIEKLTGASSPAPAPEGGGRASRSLLLARTGSRQQLPGLTSADKAKIRSPGGSLLTDDPSRVSGIGRVSPQRPRVLTAVTPVPPPRSSARNSSPSPRVRAFAPTVQHLQSAAHSAEAGAQALQATLSSLRRERASTTIANAEAEAEAEAERERRMDAQRERDERLARGRSSQRAVAGGGGGGVAASSAKKAGALAEAEEEHEAWEVDIPESDISFDEYDDLIGAGGQVRWQPDD
jgi:hypothetical protein